LKTTKSWAHGHWVVEIGRRMYRIEVAGDIFLRMPRPTQGCRADDTIIIIVTIIPPLNILFTSVNAYVLS
jgi:hypothetical protein